MGTIELAVGRMREAQRPRTVAATASASPSQVSPPPPVLSIKTRVLCDYGADAPAEHAAVAPAVQGVPAAKARAPLAPVAMLSALAGAALMYGFLNLQGKPAVTVPDLPRNVQLAAPAAVGPVSSNPPATPEAPPALAAAPAAPIADPVREAQVLVANWAQAWSDRDVPSYLGFYASSFKPDKGLARGVWEAARRKRLSSARSISVAVHDLRVESAGPDRLIVRFAQDYVADTYRETGTPKQLHLVRESAGWRIAAEAETGGSG